jgi:hypothetical protein
MHERALATMFSLPFFILDYIRKSLNEFHLICMSYINLPYPFRCFKAHDLNGIRTPLAINNAAMS